MSGFRWNKERTVPRVISFFLLVAILALAGAIFFQVMAPFILPMFLAAVLVVVFRPLHSRVRDQMPLRPRLAALLTTAFIMCCVLMPTAFIAWKAYQESDAVVDYLQNPKNAKYLADQFNKRAQTFTDFYEQLTGEKFEPNAVTLWLRAKVTEYGPSTVTSVLGAAAKLLVGALIMSLALYYFLADGPQIVHSMMVLSPLDPEYEQELLNRFVSVSRAVVSASLLSAVVQGLLAGIGFYFALNAGAPLFLLIALTMVGAVVPFVGAAGIWIPTCLWIYLYQPTVVDGVAQTGDTVSAVALAIYCASIVSTIDNLIKPWVLHGQSNLHPLLALLSVLGGLAALGPVGLLVGPMIVAFVQALLVMVNKELVLLGSEPKVIDMAITGAEPPPPLEGPPAAAGASSTASSKNGSTGEKPKSPAASSAASTRAAKRRRGRK